MKVKSFGNGRSKSARRVCIAVLLGVLLLSAAGATITPVSGATKVDGTTNAARYGPNAYNDNTTMFCWDELQPVTLSANLHVDIYTLGVYYNNYHSYAGTDILAGTTVESHYFHWDPLDFTQRSAEFSFDQPILGIIVLERTLADSDSMITNGDASPGAFTYRGLEDSQGDTIEFLDPLTVRVTLYASSPGDQVRVITESSETTRILATTVTVNPGIVVSGAPTDLYTSNDQYYVLRPGIVLSSGQDPLVINLSGNTPGNNPSQLQIVIESHANQGSVRQTVSEYNFNTAMYEQVDQYVLATSDMSHTLNLSSASQYFGPGNEVRAQIRCRTVGPVLSYPWTVSYDEVTWRYTP